MKHLFILLLSSCNYVFTGDCEFKIPSGFTMLKSNEGLYYIHADGNREEDGYLRNVTGDWDMGGIIDSTRYGATSFIDSCSAKAGLKKYLIQQDERKLHTASEDIRYPVQPTAKEISDWENKDPLTNIPTAELRYDSTSGQTYYGYLGPWRKRVDSLYWISEKQKIEIVILRAFLKSCRESNKNK